MHCSQRKEIWRLNSAQFRFEPYNHLRLAVKTLCAQVVGRKAPTEAEPSPPAFRMKLFAPNEVIAKSRFWYFLHQVIRGIWKNGVKHWLELQ